MDLPGFVRKERIHILNKRPLPKDGKYVLYFMEASQRSRFNYALETSIHIANSLGKPLLVYFGITDRYRYSNIRYYTFMLEGMLKVRERLSQRGIKLVILKEDPPAGAIKLAKSSSILVLDRGYLRHQRIWRKRILESVDLPTIEIEGDVVIPVEFASSKLQNSARVIRSKVKDFLFYFLEDLPILEPKISSNSLDVEEWNEESVGQYLAQLKIDKTVTPVEYFRGGEDEAQRKLRVFIDERLENYARFRTDPGISVTSELSPYLRFGQISPVEIVKSVLAERDLKDPNVIAFFDQLIVWRELSRNYAWYNPLYNEYEGLPIWARRTLEEHMKDPREAIYDLPDLEEGKTADPIWNFAQKDLLERGTMHNYLRMYWCKKLIEWTDHPKRAFDIAAYLNDKYALDGRDPNGYLGIAWCFGALDRPHRETKIFGKVRKMTSKAVLSKTNFRDLISSSRLPLG